MLSRLCKALVLIKGLLKTEVALFTVGFALDASDGLHYRVVIHNEDLDCAVLLQLRVFKTNFAVRVGLKV
jgi:hypothetical protein